MTESAPSESTRGAVPGDRLVVIGASAGGIEALSTVVAGLPADFPAPVVIAQHLDPRRRSHLAEILSRRAPLEVRIVDDRVPLEDGVIYVVPSNHHVEIIDHHIRLEERSTTVSTPSVDRLLETAAKAYGPSLVAVILTGSGSDGSTGARVVNETGGTVVIENPATAAFPSMPQSLPTTIVDAVADLGGMGDLLVRLVSPIVTGRVHDGPELEALLEQLRVRSGIDFASYKRPTIVRRLQTRMVATDQPDLRAYVALVERDPVEYARLLSSLLIKVTGFFRDPKVWAYLASEVMPSLVATARREGRELRLWSAGCSTGEEAYSLALLVLATVGSEPLPEGVRIFATDVDSDAIAFARRGVYPSSVVEDVPADLRDRAFVAIDGRCEIVKAVRDLVVFGEHDLGHRAPFPQIDLVLCRNVLIYFTPAMQRAALETFAFSLRAGGGLVLGSSETTAAWPDPFVEEETRLRVYRRTTHPERPGSTRPLGGRLPRTAAGAALERAIARTRRDTGRRPEGQASAERILLELEVGVVVIDREYDIERINGSARRLLGIHGIAFDQDLIHLADGVPSSAFREAIDSALNGATETRTLTVAAADLGAEGSRELRIRVTPYRPDPEGGIEGAIIELVDVSDEQQERTKGAGLQKHATRLSKANDELTRTIAQLRASNEAMLYSSEDAQWAREEVQTLNEEMQATNEELETLNEELTASVEELTAANDVLTTRTEELAAEHLRSEDQRARIEAILSSQGDGVLVVDGDGQPALTNAAYERMFGPGEASFEPEDAAGRPIPPKAWPQRRAARGERFTMSFTVRDPGGDRRWFEAVGEPLIAEGRMRGGVLTIRDHTERTVRGLLEQVLIAASHELRTPLAALNGYIQLVDRHLARGDQEQAAHYAATALEQTRRLGDLLDRLFDVSRIRSGTLSIDAQAADLVEVVERAVAVASGVEGAPPIIVERSASALPVTVDAGRIEQLLIILLSNAIEHATGSDLVHVHVRRTGDLAEVAVADQGPGIAPADLPNLFEPFAQRHDGAREADGLGLGLYIARQIATGHAGTLTVDSTPGVGATFLLRLPLGGTAAKRSKRAPRTGPDGAG